MAETVCFNGCFGCIDAQVPKALVDFTASSYHIIDYSVFAQFCLLASYTLARIQFWHHMEESNKRLCRTFPKNAYRMQRMHTGISDIISVHFCPSIAGLTN